MALSNEELHEIFQDAYFAWHRSGFPATGGRLDTKSGLQAVARAVVADCAAIAESEITRASYNARADVAIAIRNAYGVPE